MNSVTPLFLAILPIIGTTTFILMCTDQIRRRWERAASNDYLTGLPNRRTLNEVGSERFEATGEREAHHAVAVLDIDNFKLINDSHGHDIGDKVLKHVAFQLQDSMEQGDFVARSGGEEFVIIFGKPTANWPQRLPKRSGKIERDVFVIGDVKIKVTVSIGVAKQKNTLSTFDSILRQADMALYEAKSQGKIVLRQLPPSVS